MSTAKMAAFPLGCRSGARAWLGRLPGGLGSVTVAGTMIFGGISGSSAADAAAFSKIGTEGMSTQGFRRDFGACLVASSSTLDIVVPSSIAMVIYGSLTDISIGALTFGGITPGILFGLIHMAYVAWVARRDGIGLDQRRYTWAERWGYSLRLLPIFGIMFIVLWGFYTGQFTATEVSTMSALASLLVALFIYRTLRPREIPRVLAKTAGTSAAIFLIIADATVFAKALTVSGFTARAVALIKWAVKLHLLLDHDGHLPSVVVITQGRRHDVRVARTLRFDPGTIVVMDRGYVDYVWFGRLTTDEGVFRHTAQG